MSWGFMLSVVDYILVFFSKIICNVFKIFLVFVKLNFDSIMNNAFWVIKIIDNNIFKI